MSNPPDPHPPFWWQLIGLIYSGLSLTRELYCSNMLVLARDAQGRPTAMLGPYWTMLVFVTARRPRPCCFSPALAQRRALVS